MNKKTLTELRPVVRSLGQDLRALKATFDALRAASSLKSDGSAALLTLAEREFSGAVNAMKSRIDQIVAVIDIDVDAVAINTAGEMADHTD